MIKFIQTLTEIGEVRIFYNEATEGFIRHIVERTYIMKTTLDHLKALGVEIEEI